MTGAAPPLSVTVTVNVTVVGVAPVLHGFPTILAVVLSGLEVKLKHTPSSVGTEVDVAVTVYGSTPPVNEIGAEFVL